MTSNFPKDLFSQMILLTHLTKTYLLTCVPWLSAPKLSAPKLLLFYLNLKDNLTVRVHVKSRNGILKKMSESKIKTVQAIIMNTGLSEILYEWTKYGGDKSTCVLGIAKSIGWMWLFVWIIVNSIIYDTPHNTQHITF